jgi:hypothetical protein
MTNAMNQKSNRAREISSPTLATENSQQEMSKMRAARISVKLETTFQIQTTNLPRAETSPRRQNLGKGYGERIDKTRAKLARKNQVLCEKSQAEAALATGMRSRNRK